MTKYIDRNQGTRQHTHPELSRERYRDFFACCPRCGIVRDLRFGKYLSESDAQELDEMFSDCKPSIPAGDLCGWCEDEVNARRAR